MQTFTGQKTKRNIQTVILHYRLVGPLCQQATFFQLEISHHRAHVIKNIQQKHSNCTMRKRYHPCKTCERNNSSSIEQVELQKLKFNKINFYSDVTTMIMETESVSETSDFITLLSRLSARGSSLWSLFHQQGYCYLEIVQNLIAVSYIGLLLHTISSI